jgi:WD40 repeat protein
MGCFSFLMSWWISSPDVDIIGVLSVVDWLGHRNAVFDVEWMPGENQLMTASGDQTINLWDVATEQIISVFRGHSSSVKVVRFLPSQSGSYTCIYVGIFMLIY